jgi:hypothetical protein
VPSAARSGTFLLEDEVGVVRGQPQQRGILLRALSTKWRMIDTLCASSALGLLVERPRVWRLIEAVVETKTGTKFRDIECG